MSRHVLTVGITTRDRPAALARCLRSLSCIADLAPQVLVFDDASRTSAPLDAHAPGIRTIRDDRGVGYIVGRNRLVKEASAGAVLLLDDDAALVDGDAVRRALRVLESDPWVAAVAFAQADDAGKPWARAMQAAVSDTACYVPSFIGFAHLVRRDVFLALGGYRERFVFYGEEKDFCLRLLEAGYRTVYLPDARVMHQPDDAGRCPRRHLRYVTRNDCLAALYNDPLPRLLWILPARLVLYFRMRRDWNVTDHWGWGWVLREVIENAPAILRERRAVSSRTLALWARLRREPEPYPGTTA